MADPNRSDNVIKIKAVTGQERCDVCHQSDMFDPETKFCGRCQHIALVKAIEEPKLNAAPLPEFLVKRLSSNVSIRCASCGQFIMSRSPTCRHCGNYVRFEDAAEATQDERTLNQAFENVQSCKAASILSWDFLRLHMWGFPLTLLLTPLSALVSLGLFLRTAFLGALSIIKLLRYKKVMDPRIAEGQRETWLSMGKSAGAFSINVVVAAIIIYSGAMALPSFWDNYAKGRREFDARNFVAAETFFNKALESNPNNSETHLFYARAIWNQYIDDVNASPTRNREIIDRAIKEYRTTLDQTQDLKTKDQIYTEIATIYKTIKNRDEFEQWMLGRAKLPNQTLENKVDSYIRISTDYANDISAIMENYVIKNSYPRAWTPAKEWKPEDVAKITASASKAMRYLDDALDLDPKSTSALPLRSELDKELFKIRLEVTPDKNDPFK